MQSRTIQRALPKRIPLTKVQTRTMSFYPHAFFSPPAPSASTFSPLFRLLDDYDTYSRQTTRQIARAEKTFVPKFDVKEIPTHFELHGELAGINQRDVTIEFTDPQTMSIRGRTERSYTAGTPPAAIEAGAQAPAITQCGTTSPKSGRHATIEDEEGESATSVAAPESAQPEKAQKKEPEERFWVSERSVGSFERAFTFPGRIDQDGVTASMKDGILSVVVPKAKKHESRKIEIM
ncbi:hypothetical protein VC83_02553 [Pseudogymnoascus destructans]|uniref:SHSP domain-containing protein n=2 Tax=Pseudogymnoascus destructans TaxID=655981 RepID=L8FPJ0_PSED2|nr:uncharacterized protein VC83_02553 [Pseudogymnoascus destructans]ELR02403.1 hypothetical protein GMDG_05461 [Pseudogymnoascus destructans 20631-21]OAF61094.1 hypothetical protein VC83_02553 [Pseudogymnoascus destructans]